MATAVHGSNYDAVLLLKGGGFASPPVVDILDLRFAVLYCWVQFLGIDRSYIRTRTIVVELIFCSWVIYHIHSFILILILHILHTNENNNQQIEREHHATTPGLVHLSHHPVHLLEPQHCMIKYVMNLTRNKRSIVITVQPLSEMMLIIWNGGF